MRGDQHCNCQCHWNWGWLAGAFGNTKISPFYVDQLIVVEREGLLFFIETKHADEQLSIGQKIALEHASNVLGCRAFLVRGERDSPVSYQQCKNGVWQTEIPTSQAKFKAVVSGWFRWANT